jgi:D-alanyl-D-alanine carboxypeptidase
LKRLIGWLLALTILNSGVMLADVQLPDSTAGRLFSAWLHTLNKGDRNAMQQFTQTNLPNARPGFTGFVFDQTGGLDVQQVEPSTDSEVVVLVRARGPRKQLLRISSRITLETEPRIADLRLSDATPAPGGIAAPRPADNKRAEMTEADAIARLQAQLARDAASGRFSGSVIVSQNGKTIFSQAYGVADRAKNTPNTLDTRFRIGSMNKMFTATAVLQLAQAGKLSLNDPIGKYINDYPVPEVARIVTVHHLLTHTGGTGDIFGPDFFKHRMELRTHDDYLRLFGKRTSMAAPGPYAYSNFGMILAGVIVERVSGQSYYEYVEEHIFKPAGMTSTGSEPEHKDVSGRATGYMKSPDGGLIPNTDVLPYRGTSAGGGYSTVGDLVKFAEALLNHKLLNARFTDLLIQGKVDAGEGRRYAYGFEDGRRDGAGAVGHGGSAPGMSGDLRIYPKTGYVVAALCNIDPPAARSVSRYLDLQLPK